MVIAKKSELRKVLHCKSNYLELWNFFWCIMVLIWKQHETKQFQYQHIFDKKKFLSSATINTFWEPKS
jgi:hypothetical protein